MRVFAAEKESDGQSWAMFFFKGEVMFFTNCGDTGVFVTSVQMSKMITSCTVDKTYLPPCIVQGGERFCLPKQPDERNYLISAP